MGKSNVDANNKCIKKSRIATASTPEARENEMISIAMNTAEERIRNGKASDGLLIHFLKLGTQKEKLEKDLLEKQKTLLEAKTDSLKSNKQNQEMYAQALKAMQLYSGKDEDDFNEY